MLKPFDITSQESSLPDELTDILVDAGLAAKKIDSDAPNTKIDNARRVFTASGASLDNIASTVSNIMRNGDTDSGRLKAAELALKVHGIVQELDAKPIPQITINVIGSENKTLINLVVPTIL